MKRAPLIVVQLVHIQGPMKGEIQEFTQQVITIGRLPDSVLCFPKDLGIISRKHAEITRDGNRFKLVDFSANGTFVNGKRINAEVILKNGDVLTFAEGGPKVSFLTMIKEGEAVVEADAPPPPSAYEQVQPRTQRAPSSPRPEPLRPEPPRPEPSRPAPPRREPPRPEPPMQEVPAQVVNMPLVCQYGPTLRSFKQLPVTIGKHPTCQLTIDHPAILDMHAQIFYAQNQYWIKDLTGRGSLRINGEPIGNQAPLKASDVLAMSAQGPVFRFLGEGRLAEEIQESAPDAFDAPQGKEAKPQPGRQESEVKKGTKERSSFLKRFIP
jgi:pSer/pThr/pTyr-binding forkhead associated (FHA) protein